MKNDPLKKVEEVTQHVHKLAETHSKPILEKYPLLFSMLTTLGVVSVLYGFERVMHNIPLFREHPWIILLFGLLILLGTGSLYKRLQ